MPTETDRVDSSLLTRTRREVRRHFRRGLTILMVLLLTLATAPAAMAQRAPLRSEEAQERLEDADARLRGYESDDVILDHSSAALTYFLLAALAVLGVGVMFKSARRTHLD